MSLLLSLGLLLSLLLSPLLSPLRSPLLSPLPSLLPSQLLSPLLSPLLSLLLPRQPQSLLRSQLRWHQWHPRHLQSLHCALQLCIHQPRCLPVRLEQSAAPQ